MCSEYCGPGVSRLLSKFSFWYFVFLLLLLLLAVLSSIAFLLFLVIKFFAVVMTYETMLVGPGLLGRSYGTA